MEKVRTPQESLQVLLAEMSQRIANNAKKLEELEGKVKEHEIWLKNLQKAINEILEKLEEMEGSK